MFDNIATIIGILGAYFAMVFVLSISVETILEPFTSLPWLRKKLNPDDILKDIKEWLPFTLLRVVSALMGMAIAIMLRIDTFDIIGVLLPVDVQNILTRPDAQLGGMLITGLAASAGSSFWHDMLGRVRNLKDVVQEVSQVQVVQKA